jgi:hypothetical protein
MTVYVDDFQCAYEPPHRRGRTYMMSHMIADTDEELHAMADRIGVARKWFQKDHYDIAKSKRALALSLGAVSLDTRTLAAMACYRRFTGEPLGDPATARARMDAYWKARKAARAKGAEG